MIGLLSISCASTKKTIQEDKSIDNTTVFSEASSTRQREQEKQRSVEDSNINEISGMNISETNIFQDSLGNKTTSIRQISYSKNKISHFSSEKERQKIKEKDIDSLSIVANQESLSIKKISSKEQSQNTSRQYIWIIIIIVIAFFILNIF